MNRNRRDRLYAFTMAELLAIMILSGAVFLSVMEGVALFRKYGFSIASRIGRNSGFFADYCRLEDMVRNADSIRATGEGVCEMYYEGSIRHRLVQKDSSIIAYSAAFQDTMSVRIIKLSVVSGKDGFQTAGRLSVIAVTSKGEELPLSFKAEQDVRNEIVMGLIERENEYKMDVSEK